MLIIVAIFWLSVALFILGFVLFVYYMRTRRRWAWEIAVAIMALGVFGISIWH